MRSFTLQQPLPHWLKANGFFAHSFDAGFITRQQQSFGQVEVIQRREQAVDFAFFDFVIRKPGSHLQCGFDFGSGADDEIGFQAAAVLPVKNFFAATLQLNGKTSRDKLRPVKRVAYSFLSKAADEPVTKNCRLRR
jgi:hypothetical protein